MLASERFGGRCQNLVVISIDFVRSFEHEVYRSVEGRLVLADALLAESGRSLLHHLVTDFDAKPTFAGDAPLYRFCPTADLRGR